jgi:diketogulonate reductase-like aldo/keto reductase
MHWPDSNIDMKETMRALKTLYDEGKVKAVGVSNFTITHLKQYLPYAKEIGLPIVMNQVEFHPLLYQKELLDYCTENGIAVTAYSPLARGEVFKNKTLQDISEKHNVTAAQISLAWLMHHGLVVIPKASSKEHLKSNLDADSITLSDEDIEAINTIDEQRRLVNPEFGEFDEM